MDSRRKPWVILSSLVLLVTFLLYYSSWTTQRTPLKYAEQAISKPAFKAPKENIWAELSEREAADVNAFILKEYAHLNLTEQPKNANENSIFFVETLRPNKTDAVPYLHGHGEIPQRYAKAAISMEIDGLPHMVYYMVGPLPISSESKISPLQYVFNNGKNSVQNPVSDFFALMDYCIELGVSISDITQNLLGASVNQKNPEDPNGLMAFPRPTPIETGEGGLILWIQFQRPGFGSGGRTLLPQGLYAKVDASSENRAEWKPKKFYYNGVLYNSEDEIRAAMSDPDFVRVPTNIDGPWTDTEDFDSQPDGREMPPPVSIQPYGPRYGLDRTQRFISWFGFEFYITTAQATGVSLFDIRFKGERVMYEVGMQEALSHYAGNQPMNGGLEFLDTFFGMGKKSFELVPGYDCPAHADYLDIEYHELNKTHKIPNSICIFEFTADHLLSRHSAQYSVTASRNTFLTVRYVSTVGNYDYDFSYIFYMDGTMEVKVRASGYIFAAFYSADEKHEKGEYGHRIQDALESSMHDHVINFRADLDVAGEKNEMVRMAVEPVTKTFSWDQPENPSRNTMHLVDYPVTEETGLDWPKNSREFYLVRSTEQKNAWGQPKGYRITSGTGMGNPPHLTIVNSTVLGESGRWAEHDIWALRHKDTEPRSADPLNYFATHEPLVDFKKQANHESFEDEDFNGDMVFYFNLGAHHVPHSGDVPNTLMHTSASSVMFVPHNFCDRDPSRESVQGVRLQLKGHRSGGFAGEEFDEPNGDLRSRMDRHSHEEKKKKKTKAHYFGQTYEEGMKVPLEALEPNQAGYISEQNFVSDLGFNGSAIGAWHRDEA
ncbi:Hypothetical protein R9X50_00606800 [Acrodontium crateriforme]|uniref:Amine oxidase n=1 Tax=Acrodontium crateriforme TaxID=150365 RepID=A0AAQ3M7B7_9PEZI|nr:Hypothetical protein R9X50_00606800 [Acrodontium crateriforme]